MRKVFINIVIGFISIGQLFAHSAGNFYEHCDNVSLPDCTFHWNAVTTTDVAFYAVGNGGTLFISYHDGGVTTINTGVSDTLSGIKFLNNSLGYMWGAGGTLLKTSNAGIDWLPIVTDTTSRIDQVQFIDENNGYFMVDTIIHRTVNGGVSWTELVLPTSISFQDFHFFDALNGQICGHDTTTSIEGFLYTTNNGGASWSQTYTDTIAFTQLDYPNNTLGFLYGTTINAPVLLKSNNSGVTWDLEYTTENWALESEVVIYKNKTHFITNQEIDHSGVFGKFLYGSSLFGNAPDGIVTNGKNIFTSVVNGKEVLHITAASGIYRYFEGQTICTEVTFDNLAGLTEDSLNHYNVMGAGRVLAFKPLVYNTNTDTLFAASCKVSCRSPFITILDSIAIVGKVSPSNNSHTVDDFQMLLHSDIPDNYVVHLEFEFYDKTPDTVLSRSVFDLPIILSPFIIQRTNVYDTTTVNYTANDNGIADIGEAVSILPLAQNMSVHDFYNIKGYLYSFYNEVDVWNNRAHPNGAIVQKNTYSYGGGLSSLASSVSPVGSYAITNNFDTLYQIPLTMFFSGAVTNFKDANGCGYSGFFGIDYNWRADFFLNDTLPAPPDSLYDGFVEPIETELLDTIKKGSDTTKTIIETAIKEEHRESLYNVFPNPSRGVFTITVSGQSNLDLLAIEMYDLLGNNVKQITYNYNNTSLDIDISSFASGVYWIRITSDNGTETRKIIKTD